MSDVDGIGILLRGEAEMFACLVVTAYNPVLWNLSTQNPFFIFYSTSDNQTGLWENFKYTIDAPWIHNSQKQGVCICMNVCGPVYSLIFHFRSQDETVSSVCPTVDLESFRYTIPCQSLSCFVYFTTSWSRRPDCSARVQTRLNKSKDVIPTAITHTNTKASELEGVCAGDVVHGKWKKQGQLCFLSTRGTQEPHKRFTQITKWKGRPMKGEHDSTHSATWMCYGAWNRLLRYYDHYSIFYYNYL